MSVKDSVLKILKENSGSFFSGEEISESLGVSRAAVWKSINSLRSEGYVIEAVKNRGYMMPSEKGFITSDSLRSALSAPYRDNELYVYDCIDSTNMEARRLLLSEKAPVHGAVVASNQQTSGRGRLGRSFFSPQNGLYVSIIVHPDFDINKSTLATVAAAVATADAIESVCGQTPVIKWVNDVLCDNKKVCGILTEATTDFESGQIENLIIGIGVNTSTDSFPEELSEIVGAVQGDYSKSALVARIIENTLENISELSSPDSPSFMESYRKRSVVLGKTVKVYKGTYRKNPAEELGGITAKVLSIDDNGGLEVIYTDGSREILTTGEISIRL